MKKFTKVCLIIAAVLMLFGVGACIVGSVMGAGMQNVKTLWDRGELQLWGWKIGSTGTNWMKNENSWKDSKRLTDTFLADEITELDIDLKYGILTIEESDTQQVIVEVEKNNGDFQTVLENGRLSLKDNRKDKTAGKEYKICLQLPKSMELEQIDIENNAGTLESDDILLKSEKMNVKVDAGEVLFDGVQTKEFSLEVGAGNADIDNLDAEDIDIDCGVGNIDLVLLGREEDYDYKAECGLGNIEIGEQSYTSLGKCKEISHGAHKNVHLNCGVGNINIDTE